MQKGRSMVEMMGVLVIIAVVTVSILTVWSQMRIKMRITQAQNEIFQIARDTASLYTWARDYEYLDIKDLCENNVFPAGCGSDNNTPLNPFGGDYRVERVQEGENGKYPRFELLLTGLPSQGVCDEILSYEFEGVVSATCPPDGDGSSVRLEFQ